ALFYGSLACIVYALVAVALVIVYKASRVINFSLGEWVMLGARLTAVGLNQLAWGLGVAAGGACAGMVGFAVVWNRIVLRRLVGQPLGGHGGTGRRGGRARRGCLGQ